MNRLQDRVAIITGGARGIGKVTAELFVREGARVAIWDVDTEEGEKTAEALGASALFQQVDTSDYAGVEAAASAAFQAFGRLDILVNNAGITRDATLLKMEPEVWQKVIDINLTGVFNCTRAVAPYLVEQGSGRIISASSVVGLYGNYGQTNYVASKAGVIGMTRVWARELGPKGITANAVAPGFIATEMVQTIPGKVLEAVRERTPLKKFGRPEDIAHAYLFLASDEAAFINGAVLNVDGGITI